MNDLSGYKVAGVTEGIVKNQCNIFIDSIAAGKYSIQYFHDENNNNELDANLIGIPKEGYGFSNNAIGNFGTPPPIEEKIMIISDDKSISLKPVYFHL